MPDNLDDPEYFYEFGIFMGNEEDDSDDTETAELGLCVIDLREIKSFARKKNVKGPLGTYPDVTQLDMGEGSIFSVIYPYREFKNLFEQVLGVVITKMPYPGKLV